MAKSLSSGRTSKRGRSAGRGSVPESASNSRRHQGRPQKRREPIGKSLASQRASSARTPKKSEIQKRNQASYPPPPISPIAELKKSRKKTGWFGGTLWFFATCLFLGGIIAAGIGWSQLNKEADPYVKKFQNRVPPTLTKVLDIKGNIIGIYANQKRTLIPFGDIPIAFQNAIVAAEDADFWEHRGISARGFFGAIWRGAKSLGKDRSGFSTLTMQLVRTVTEKRERSLLKGAIKRKLLEIVIAIRLEKVFNKREIMEMYTNEVNFGAGHYGIEMASQYYFGKISTQLSVEESALLAALVQSPSRSHNRLFSTNPNEREIVRNRRNYVLTRMADEGKLTDSDAEFLKKTPIRLSRENARDAEIAAYVVEEVRKELLADEELQEKLVREYGKDWLMEGGLEIHTTIDAVMQQAATDSIREGLQEVDKRRGFRKDTVRFYANPDTDRDSSWQRFYEPGDMARGIILDWIEDTVWVRMGRTTIEVPSTAFAWAGEEAQGELTRGTAPLFKIKETNPDGTPSALELAQIPEVEGALLAVESRTGEIRAMVGGYDFRRSQFNRATQAVRQVGSTMKSFVYGAALTAGYTPATIVNDTPIKYQLGTPGAPPKINRRTGKNEDEYQPKNYEHDYWGPLTFWESLSRSRNIPAVKVLEMTGISKTREFANNCGIEKEKIPPFPSMALGATELSLKEMVRGYATIASGGYKSPKPFLIKSVVDRNGKVLKEYKPTPRGKDPDIDPVAGFQLIQMLQAVTSSGSAGGTSSALGKPVAGKTGTTDEFSDAWFVGFSTRITCGVWVGLDAKSTIHRGANGAKTALPIWTKFMRVALMNTPKEDFTPPKGLEFLDIDVDTGLRAGSGTRRRYTLAFRPGTGPAYETDYDVASQISEARARAKFLELEERQWGVLTPKKEPPPDDPND